jgi:transcriptional regulator GlxA family with amidase domain
MALSQLTQSSPELARMERVGQGFVLSTRTLLRHMRATLGISLIAFVRRLRIERAVHAVGYANETSLRRILVRELGASLSKVRHARNSP